MEGCITRAFYCPVHKHEVDFVYVWGSTNKQFMVKKIRYYEIRHIVPHLITATQRDDHMEVTVNCCVMGCGTMYNNTTGKYSFKLRKYKMSFKDWNALLMFKNTGYEIF